MNIPPPPPICPPAPDPGRRARIAARIGVPLRYAGGFDTFTAGESEFLARLIERSKEWTRSIDVHRDGICLYGGAGIGKTHLACAILLESVEQGASGLFVGASDLFHQLRSRFAASGDMPTAEDLIDDVRGVELLVLDDLGTETPSDWVADRLFLILNHRYVAQLPTIITSNLSLEEFAARLGHIGERLADRMRSMCKLAKLPAVNRRG